MSIAAAFLRACRLDVAVPKPGNVSLAAPGHGMQAAQFVASAEAAVGALCRPGAAVGERIEGAVRASVAAAGCNTNLGIVLLCAPLAAAAERDGACRSATALRGALADVLDALGVDDARAAYRAIALAGPGGLGRAEAQDVHAEPTVDLRAAMVLAAGRDRIAAQYANGFADLFDIALGHVPAALLGDGSDDEPPSPELAAAVQRLYLECLARWPDSHIVRKHGEAVAQIVMSAAQGWRTRERPGLDPGFAAWDATLKAAGINPGTSADLTVATLFAAGLLAPPRPPWHGS